MLFCSINWPAKVVIIADITKCARCASGLEFSAYSLKKRPRSHCQERGRQFLIPNFSFLIPNYQLPLSRWSIRAVTSPMFTLPS